MHFLVKLEYLCIQYTSVFPFKGRNSFIICIISFRFDDGIEIEDCDDILNWMEMKLEKWEWETNNEMIIGLDVRPLC